MQDETKAAGEQAVGGETPAQKIDKNILRPVDELIKTIHHHDTTFRTVLGTLKRLWKKSKGAGNATLTEVIQLFASLHGYVNLKATQDTIVGQQLAAENLQSKLHAYALQNFMLERLLGGPEPKETEEAPLKGKQKRLAEAWEEARTRIDELFKEAVEREKALREKMFEQHKEDVLESAVNDLKRPSIEKTAEEKKEAERPAPKLVLPN